MRFLLNEGSLNVTTFRYCGLGFFLILAWNPLGIHFQSYSYIAMDAVTVTFHVFGKYIFPQLQTCSEVRALIHLVYLQWLTGYRRLTLVLVWNSPQREKFNFCFQEFSFSIDKTFILAGGLSAGLSFYVV